MFIVFDEMVARPRSFERHCEECKATTADDDDDKNIRM